MSSDWVTDDRIVEDLGRVTPGGRSGYLDSRQRSKTLHQQFFERVQVWSVMTSIGFVVLCLLFFRKRLPDQAHALIPVIAYVLVANAAITGALSEVADRYQGRVIWLLPLLAGLLLFSRQEAHPRVADDGENALSGSIR